MIICKQFVHQIFSSRAYIFPVFVISTELALSDSFNNFIFICTIEWRIAAEQNEEYNTNAPDVAFFVVIIIEDLRSYVIWSAVLLTHFLILYKWSWSPKINNGNFRIIDISIHQNIFWF